MDWGGIWSLTWSSARSIATSLWLRPAPFLAMLPIRWLRIGSSTTTRSLSSHPVSSKYGGGGPCVCSLCDGGWGHIGCPWPHALALLKQLAEFDALSRAWLLLLSGQPCPSHCPNAGFALGAALEHRASFHLASWLHVTLSQHFSSCCACTTMTGLSLQCLARCIA